LDFYKSYYSLPQRFLAACRAISFRRLAGRDLALANPPLDAPGLYALTRVDSVGALPVTLSMIAFATWVKSFSAYAHHACYVR